MGWTIIDELSSSGITKVSVIQSHQAPTTDLYHPPLKDVVVPVWVGMILW